jgi:hypothetical protein
MANLPEVDQFDTGVYQLETTDPALGGANGVMNTPPKSLVNRTRYLLNRMLDGILSFVKDSGAANAIVASLPQPIAALVDGMEVSVRIGYANATATTLKLANTGGAALPTLPIYGGDHAALPGGEFPVGAVARFKYNALLNASSGGAWVVMAVTGGYARIPTAPAGDTSTMAANMAAVFSATDGLATVSVGVGADVVLTAAQYGCAIIKLTGTPTAAINLVLPSVQSGQWIIDNQQGGTNNITVKPAGGVGVVLPQGSSPVIVTSDGSTAKFASAQAGQALMTSVPITGVTGTTLVVAGGYTPGAIFIEKNGGVLEAPDFAATTSPNITLTKAAVSTDYFTVYRFTTFAVANAVQKSGDTMGGPLVLAGGDTISAVPAAGDSSSKIPSTAWVSSQIGFKNRSYDFNTPGTYSFTVPLGVTTFYVSGCGGGGGGGGGAGGNTSNAGGGGAGGGAAKWVDRLGFTVTPGQVLTIVIPVGGTPGSGTGGTAGTAGGNGNPTTITGTSVSITLDGGSGGSFGTYNASLSGGGYGGAGFPGGDPGGSATPSAPFGPGGRGGGCPFGDGGAGGYGGVSSGSPSTQGGAGYGYGSGGGGGGGGYLGASNVGFNGGTGANGRALLEW